MFIKQFLFIILFSISQTMISQQPSAVITGLKGDVLVKKSGKSGFDNLASFQLVPEMK